MATHSSILARRIPWTDDNGRLQSMGLQRVRHNWVTNTFTFTLIKGSLVPLCFLPLEWYHLYIWGFWYFSWQSLFQLVIHPAWRFTWCTLHRSWISRVKVYLNKLLSQFWTSLLVHVCSNCCFLIYIQVSLEAGKVDCYYRLFKNFPEFVVIHTVKGFSVANETEVNFFLEFLCFACNPTDVGNLFSACSKSNLYIWKFLVHLLLKPNLKNFEHYLASM